MGRRCSGEWDQWCAATGSRPNLAEVFFSQIMTKNEIVLVVIISEALWGGPPFGKSSQIILYLFSECLLLVERKI